MSSNLNQCIQVKHSFENITFMMVGEWVGQKAKTSAAGFEPARENPADFESASLTTRTY